MASRNFSSAATTSSASHSPGCLCLSMCVQPTRELAQQIQKVVRSLGDFLNVTSHACVGGTLVRDDIRILRDGVQVVVGTPGRVYDMIKRQELSLAAVKIFVLDEADEMLSRGFKDQIYDVFQHLPAKVQVCLFSATMPEEILEISQRFMRNPIRILVKRDELTLEGIRQFYIAVEREDWKLETLCDLYETLTITQAIIYCNCFPAEDHQVLTDKGYLYLADVEAHFAVNPTLNVACYVDGKLKYSPIGPDRLVKATGTFRHIEFDKAGQLGAAPVSLVPTDNHRMYGRLGPIERRAIGTGPWMGYKQGVTPAYAIHSAGSVLAEGAKDNRTAFQFKANFELGVEPDGMELPFMSALGLTTPGQSDAFLQLYGYWLGGGWLDGKDGTVCFAPVKAKDWAYLQALLSQLPVTCVVQQETRDNGQRSHRINDPQWFGFFAEQYGHKYMGRKAADAVLAAAARRGGAQPAHRTGAVAVAVPMEVDASVDLAASVTSEVVQPVQPTSLAVPTIAAADTGEIFSPTPLDAEDIKSAKWLWHWVFTRLDRRQLRLLIAGLRYADGDQAHGDAGGRRGGSIYTSSTRFRDELVLILTHAGYATGFTRTLVKDEHKGMNRQGKPIVASQNGWRVDYSDDVRATEPKLVVETDVSETVKTGTVWCVEVPTKDQLIMFRRVLKTEAGVIIKAARPLIVGNTRRKVDWLTDKMSARDFTVSSMHGEMTGAERELIMKEFRSGSSRVLITTDLLARGIDVQQVSLVINYDMPANRENYIHRIGRSGRFGRKGVAINFVTSEDVRAMREIEAFYGTQIEEMPMNVADLI